MSDPTAKPLPPSVAPRKAAPPPGGGSLGRGAEKPVLLPPPVVGRSVVLTPMQSADTDPALPLHLPSSLHPSLSPHTPTPPRPPVKRPGTGASMASALPPPVVGVAPIVGAATVGRNQGKTFNPSLLPPPVVKTSPSTPDVNTSLVSSCFVPPPLSSLKGTTFSKSREDISVHIAAMASSLSSPSSSSSSSVPTPTPSTDTVDSPEREPELDDKTEGPGTSKNTIKRKSIFSFGRKAKIVKSEPTSSTPSPPRSDSHDAPSSTETHAPHTSSAAPPHHPMQGPGHTPSLKGSGDTLGHGSMKRTPLLPGGAPFQVPPRDFRRHSSRVDDRESQMIKKIMVGNLGLMNAQAMPSSISMESLAMAADSLDIGETFGGQQFVAQNAHTATSPTEVTVAVGQSLELTGSVSDGWAEVKVLDTDSVGWYPFALLPLYLQLVHSTSVTPPSPHAPPLSIDLSQTSHSSLNPSQRSPHPLSSEETSKRPLTQSAPGQPIHHSSSSSFSSSSSSSSSAPPSGSLAGTSKNVDNSSIVNNKSSIAKNLAKRLRQRPAKQDLEARHIISPAGAPPEKPEKEKSKKEKEKEAKMAKTDTIKKKKSIFGTKKLRGDQVPDVSSSMEAPEPDDDTNTETEDDSDSEDPPSPRSQAIELFETEPERAIQMLIDNNEITDEPSSIAHFLYTTDHISKESLGVFFGKKKELSVKVLESFLEEMNFTGMTFDRALRTFLFSFRLPGEAQQIDRILEAFARKYFSQNPDSTFENQDAVFILSFATIMLNTDLHNPSVKKKMTVEEFIKNNRGLNNTKDFPRVFLEEIYTRILEDEIVTRDNIPYPNALRRGWLLHPVHKRLGRKGRHWFVLDKSGLYFFKSETHSTPKGKFELRALTLKKDKPDKNKKFPILLQVTEDEKKMFEIRLFAPNQHSWVEWLTAFESSLSDL